MGASCLHILSVFSMFLVFSVPWAAADLRVDTFLQCLSYREHPSYPISGAIYTPDNSSFSDVLYSYIRNRRFMTSTTPKPLGQSYVSNNPFVILDLFNLRSITFDDATETAWVQAGATLGELYHAIAEKSKTLAFPAGVCLTLGTGGHFSGGGYGNLMRKYGLSVDNIVDAHLVDVGGRILDRNSMGEDLFWAIRGGGGASFGVILQWKIKLVPIPEVVTYFKVGRTLEEGATDVVHRWIKVAHKLPEELFIRAQPQVVQVGDQKTVNVSFIALFLGSAQELKPLMERDFPELGLKPEDLKETSWIETTLLFADFPSGTPTTVLLNRTRTPIYFKFKSDYVRKNIKKEDLTLIWKKMIELEKVFVQVESIWEKNESDSRVCNSIPTQIRSQIQNPVPSDLVRGWRRGQQPLRGPGLTYKPEFMGGSTSRTISEDWLE
ncbi:Berberine bridge enzyme-like 3 [Vitis vinifera]|uniref:Berberine bridge enzyme-like 3 n=1 Tax=Vitis vinifera TaxID=29760 RepID=A0A438CLD9_VITVI|nr:Berberine bridge enzyme-like 3 [Vitis vinifera]